MKKSILFFFFGGLFLLASCKEKPSRKAHNQFVKQPLEFAKGFEIYKKNNLTKIVIKNPYKNAETQFEYLFSSDDIPNTIKIPVKKLIATSTTHIPMIELLESENTLIAFPNTQYISSEKTRRLVDTGSIKEIGQEANLNTELVLSLQPDIVVGFSVNSSNKSLHFLKKNSINVVYNGDWLEENPLGRAEWIKFFGVLFSKEQQADSIFKVIKKDYLSVKELAKKAISKPTILSGAIMQKDIWSLPAGESFNAQLLADANTNYLWKHTTGKGSLSLSIESVFDKAQNADFWIAPGFFSTKEQLKNSNTFYTKFKAFTNNQVYTPNLKKGATGGIIYFELAPTRPDLVLKDLIKITHPELLKDYQMTFFEKME